jgi:hypothetical protein
MTLQERILYFTLITYAIIYSFVALFLRPSWLFLSNGAIRDFGVGYANKTIMPVWLFAILLGILCYICVSYVVWTYFYE